MNEAKACPFCGGEPRREDYTQFPGFYRLHCDSCMYAIIGTSWNHRTPGPATKEMVELAKSCVAGPHVIAPSLNQCEKFISEWEDK